MSTLALGLAYALASSQLSTPRTLAKIEFFTATTVFDAQVTENDPAGLNRKFVITCLRGCRRFPVYTEKVEFFPLGLFRLTDAYPLLLTTWAGGTVTHFKVYVLEPEGVRVALDEYTIGTPTISSRGGVLSVSAAQYADEGAGSHRKMLSRTWVWKNGRFQGH